MRILELLAKASRYIPEVQRPIRKVPFKEKLFWTGLILCLYYVLCEIPMIGIPKTVQADWLAPLRFILAGNSGTLMELGIGPIVTAGIIMELLVGANIVKLDLSDPEDRKIFNGAQRTLAIIMILFESSMLVLGGRYGRVGVDISYNLAGLLIGQLVLGCFLVLLMDEVVSKWGLGSGISLFIAAGVSQRIIWQSFSPLRTKDGVLIGAIPAFIESGGRAWYRGFMPDMIGFIATIVVFLIVIAVQSIRVEIPLAFARVGGARSKYPVSLLYVSNVPIIFAAALFADVVMVAEIMWMRFSEADNPMLKWLVNLLGTFNVTRGGAVRATGGLAYFMSPPRGLLAVSADPIRAVVYMALMVLACILFAVLWVELAGMHPGAVAKQLATSGVSVPGFRGSPRIIAHVLEPYISSVTILGGAIVGVIAALADFMGALGTGSGVLLTVMIIYNYYQLIMAERIEEEYAFVRKLLKGAR